MIDIGSQYIAARNNLLSNTNLLIDLENAYMSFLHQIVSSVSLRISVDFNKATELMPFWRNYPPIQRGRLPIGTSIPWSEVGQTTIVSNIIRALSYGNPEITYPGLPSGADLRFLTDDALIHFDIKITGPNDRPDEVVASPNQISGNGIRWEQGVINSPVIITGARARMIFQPELPPLYIIQGKVIPCLTFFLKGVYDVKTLGYQPLVKLELICVPNGLLTFENPLYIKNQGLFIPGKDVKGHLKKRVRVRMTPLESIASWRRITVWQL